MQQRKRYLAILVVLDVMAYVISNVLFHKSFSFPIVIAFPLMIITLIGIQFLLYIITATYARTKMFKICYAIVLIAQFVLNVYVNRDVPVSEFSATATLAYGLSLVAFSTMFYFIVQDMFANKHEGTYSLLAAVAAIFTLVAVFGYLYAIMAVSNHSLIGVESATGQQIIQRTFLLSHHVVAGFDAPS